MLIGTLREVTLPFLLEYTKYCAFTTPISLFSFVGYRHFIPWDLSRSACAWRKVPSSPGPTRNYSFDPFVDVSIHQILSEHLHYTLIDIIRALNCNFCDNLWFGITKHSNLSLQVESKEKSREMKIDFNIFPMIIYSKFP